MKKKYFDDAERALAESFERGQWRSVKNLARQQRTLRTAARRTLQKDARIKKDVHRSVVDWLLACPEKGWFRPLPSEPTDGL